MILNHCSYVLRSGPAHEIRDWNKNWDFREPIKYGTRPRTPDKNHVRSLAEHIGETGDEKAAPGKPTVSRHLLFIRHGQYVKAEEDGKRILTSCGRFVLLLVWVCIFMPVIDDMGRFTSMNNCQQNRSFNVF